MQNKKIEKLEDINTPEEFNTFLENNLGKNAKFALPESDKEAKKYFEDNQIGKLYFIAYLFFDTGNGKKLPLIYNEKAENMLKTMKEEQGISISRKEFELGIIFYKKFIEGYEQEILEKI